MAWAKRCSRGDEGFQRAELQLAQIMRVGCAPRGNAVLYDPAREDALVALLKQQEGADLEVRDDEWTSFELL